VVKIGIYLDVFFFCICCYRILELFHVKKALVTDVSIYLLREYLCGSDLFVVINN